MKTSAILKGQFVELEMQLEGGALHVPPRGSRRCSQECNTHFSGAFCFRFDVARKHTR